MIGLMWYLMGMGTTAALWGYLTLRQAYKLDWLTHLGLLAAFGMTWICVGWSWASFAEGEPQSGSMGLICFGIPALLVSLYVWRRLTSSPVCAREQTRC